ncbi:hypothetical protein G7Y31_06640 [Corynebacterium lizhenjunii]|uniref:Uncharacterized protein n=1 Tax=Corynebacterium lizhenjunii TaxID=2709394 RepID=A0A7T0KCZ4_9CORY|nr:hypothetical protein [Corynebacterium lizhenjunii]QPK78262.1 hypothetical protein G7Y31_06640 [Corynebacterium lizhenjunii]
MDARLVEVGIRLRWIGDGTDRVDWDDVVAVAHGLGQWTPTDYALANVTDVLMWISWQLGGGQGSRPEPVPRPDGAGDDAGAGESVGSGNPLDEHGSGQIRGVNIARREIHKMMGWEGIPA